LEEAVTEIEVIQNGKKETHQLNDTTPLTVICHQGGMRISVPGAINISAQNSRKLLESMDQHDWEWVSGGDLFRVLFYLVFEDSGIEIPEQLHDLLEGDSGVANIAGGVIGIMSGLNRMGVEPVRLFWEQPETGLHPRQQCKVTELLNYVTRLGSQDPNESQKLLEVTQRLIDKYCVKRPEENDAWAICQRMLETLEKKKGARHPYARFGNRTLTIEEAIIEVEERTELGNMLVDAYYAAYNEPRPT
jgi:hypothetical protein